MKLSRLTAAVALLAGCAGAPAGDPSSAASPSPAPARVASRAAAAGPVLAYVTNQDDATVSVIDLDRRELVRTVDLRRYGFSATARPHHAAVEPDGSFWYVTLIGEGKILKLDREDRLVGQSTFETPGLLALDPGRDLLLVARSMTAVNPPASIGLIRRSSMRLDELEVLFPRPHALAVHPRGGTAYAASLAVNQMAVVDVDAERARVQEVDGAHHMMLGHFAVSPDGRTLVVTGEMSGQVLVFDISDPASPRPVKTLDVGARPWHPAFTPDGRRVYVPVKGADAVVVLDARDWSVARTIRGSGIAEPDGAAVSPDGRTVIITSNNTRGAYRTAGGQPGGAVAVIDDATGQVVRVIDVGRNPTGVGAPAPR